MEVGGGTEAGAEAAVARLIARGVTGVLSFGLAGGLDPSLRPGAIVVPEAVVPEGVVGPPPPVSWPGLARPSTTSTTRRTDIVDGRPPPAMALRSASSSASLTTSPALSRALGGPTPHLLLAHTAIVATAADKRALNAATGAHLVDLESGAVARAVTAAGLPFAILRAVCDPAERDLPPAALAALDQRGAIGLARVIGSVLAHPTQLPDLLALARDAAAARRALLARVSQIGQLSIST